MANKMLGGVEKFDYPTTQLAERRKGDRSKGACRAKAASSKALDATSQVLTGATRRRRKRMVSSDPAPLGDDPTRGTRRRVLGASHGLLVAGAGTGRRAMMITRSGYTGN